MRSLNAARVSRGGRRNSTGPPGNDIVRKKTASCALLASMLRINDGSSPRAEIVQPIARTNAVSANQRWRDELRKHFNLHLLGSDVVGDVLGGDCQLVGAGDG